MNMETLWEIVSSCEISNRTAYKLLIQLKRKLGYRFFPPNLRKALSGCLNCYMQQVTAEFVVGFTFWTCSSVLRNFIEQLFHAFWAIFSHFYPSLQNF